MGIDEQYMQKALDLAILGKRAVSPNPMVGCVIVCGGKIIGEGYHQLCGQAHAEVNAVNSVENKELIKDSVVYVTLEPCSHYGKTPPCAELLVKHLPKKVVVCNLDPNPLVAGRGMKMLEDAGIETVTGVLEEKGRVLNRRFFTFMEKKRPYVILKWAETQDGFIAREDYDSKWISCEESRKLVHQWRADEDAIFVGTNTVAYDNPSLNIRFGIEGKNPVRVLLDKNLRLDTQLNVFDQSQKTIVFTEQKADNLDDLLYKQVSFNDFLFDQILEQLYQMKIQSVIIEGGTQVLSTLIDKELWDEARVFVGNKKFGKGIKSPSLLLSPTKTESITEDLLHYYFNS
ncbi:MAG: bifunctional diaminohydroxyphosphoribosylaminopyrimidine deaminase/5-amino-6-(5-phosphoribosylamino)uracil reductase RibD [Cytophagales bacterium]|nr:bifunctional diaminohydroxyphosphoribosylaminopyrimidine deaminase/5-amino-6-(5-phosphoribosylamino)uracil reductase RibD [Cytophagales bacterium]